MLKIIKHKAISMNLKRAIIIFVVISVIFAVASGVLLYTNFNERIGEEYSTTETQITEKDNKDTEVSEQRQDRDYDSEENDEEDYVGDNESWEILNFSTTDTILLAALMVITILLGITYWILCMIWAYRKATRLGINSTLWLLVTAIFTIAAIVALYLYGSICGTCNNCGCIRKKKEMFCSVCGTSVKKECSGCGQPVDESAQYCTYCGKKLK